MFRFTVIAYPIAVAGWLLARRAALPLSAVLAIAIALRALLLFPTPALSNDVFRYLWDGRVSSHGINPYAHAPNDPELATLREPWHERINHPEIATIYPPHAQLLFLATGIPNSIDVLRSPFSGVLPRTENARTENAITVWRLLIIAFDVLAILALRRHGLAFAYATFPPLLFEGVWSGHVDAIAGAFVVFAMLSGSGAAAGFAAGLKIIPGAAFPALFLRSKNRVRFAIAFLATLILPALPFLGRRFMPGFREYATRWIFNSPLYDLVFAIVERIPTKEIWTDHPLRFQAISDVVYRHIYPDFITRVTMLILACGLIAIAGRSVARAIGALLLCSPAIHPWYWLALAPAAMLERSAWLYVALCAPFSYLLYENAPRAVVYALCYGLPLITRLRPSASVSSGAESHFAALRFRRARDTSPT